MIKTLPPDLQSKFSEEKVYIRGIHEISPIVVLYLNGATEIKDSYKQPILDELLEEDIAKISYADLKQLNGTYSVTLSKEPKLNGVKKVEVVIPHPKLEGMTLSIPLTKFSYEKRAKDRVVKIDVDDALRILKGKETKEDCSVSIKAEYTPK
jgi:hypothetical protein